MTATSGSGGDLHFLKIARTLKDLYQRKATGLLRLSSGQCEKRVYFRNGIVVFASSNLEEDRLGNLLLSKGLMSPAQFEESSRQFAASGKKQGTILVQMGVLSPRELFRSIIMQVKEVVLSTFLWEEGSVDFDDGSTTEEEVVSLRIHPPALLLEGLQRAGRGELFRDRWRPAELDLALHPAPPWLPEDLHLPLEAKKLLSLIELEKDWSELPGLAGLGEDETSALLYGLSVLELISAHPTTRSAPPAEGPPPPSPPPPPAAPAPKQAEPPELPSSSEIETLHEKIDRYNHYQVLRLQPQASQGAVKNAYLSLAKRYHPDRFFSPEHADLHEKVNLLFMKINEAYTVLSSPRRRAEYDGRQSRLAREEGEAPAGGEGDSAVARQQFRRGMDLLKSADIWGAVESLRWAVNLNPQSALYHTMLGTALTRTRKRLHEAEQHCKTAITLDYSNPQYYVNLGLVYKTGHLPEKAKKQFETALKLNPKFAPALKELRGIGEGGGKGLLNKIFKK